MKQILYLFLFAIILSCKQTPTIKTYAWKAYDESKRLAENADHKSKRMQYKLIQSKHLDRQAIWDNIYNQLGDFSESEYMALHQYVYEKNILDIQSAITEGQLSYEKLTKWYLYRILKYESDSLLSLNAIISINPNAVKLARKYDKQNSKKHPIYGMPILLKDNIGTKGMPTTAGALALKENRTDNAFIVDQIESKGGLILGKVNLSEWAYYLCSGCPLGYSAIGGQSLNPYGAGKFESGGSSSGSGIAMAANYATAAVGTETSGSILSPSSLNSLVGLKPTIGLLSRSGIVPISSTLDTPGPMTRNTIDNAILLSAMVGEDTEDAATKNTASEKDYLAAIDQPTLSDKRFGYYKRYMEDSIYAATIEQIKTTGTTLIEIEPGEFDFQHFRTFLNGDMLVDLPDYMNKYSAPSIVQRTIQDFVNYNLEDTLLRVPYGQQLFEAMAKDSTSKEEFLKIKEDYRRQGIAYFDHPMREHKLDAILSINNYNAGHAAMAQYPCLTIPMGYKVDGEPINLTFIARPYEEDRLLGFAAAFEQSFDLRVPPSDYN